MIRNKKPNPLIRLWLIIGILAGFSTILFFTVSYVKNIMLCDASCAIQNEVAIALVLSALIGVFVGSLTYYFIAEKYEKKITKIHNESSATLRFLDSETKQILQALIAWNGRVSQSKLVTSTDFTRVKISRILAKLEQKGIIHKEKQGMTNTIILEEDMRKIFLPDKKEEEKEKEK